MSFEPTPKIGEGEEYVLNPTPIRYYDLEHDAKIISWRTECFEALGFSLLDARKLAVRRDVDRVVVEKAVKAGNQHRHVLEALL